MKINKELRIAVTPQCNYKCIFCHNEGVDQVSNKESKKENINNILSLIDTFVKDGYSDITLTGGEPLIYKTDIYTILEFIKEQNYSKLPDVTIVTNGSLVNEEFTKKVSTYMNLKINVSLHSFNDKVYKELTNQSIRTVQDILRNIDILISNRIKTKINYVILKDKNSSNEDIHEAITRSKELGASTIKFIELLVPDDKEGLMQYYYEGKAISSMLKEEISDLWDDGRKEGYKLKKDSSGFFIEIVKCACKNGCNKCLLYRPTMIDTSMMYYPCFVDSYEQLLIGKEDYKQKIALGKAKITKMAKIYGSLAPILNNEPTFEDSRTEIYFEMDDKTYNRFLAEYKANNFLRTRQFDASYYVYMPRTADVKWTNYEISVRVRITSSNKEEAAMVQTDNQYEIDKNFGFLITKVKFYQKNRYPYVNRLDNVKTLLTKLDFIEKYQYATEGYYFRSASRLKFSMARIQIGADERYVCCFFSKPQSDTDEIRNLITRLRLKPIDRSLYKWLEEKAMRNHNQED